MTNLTNSTTMPVTSFGAISTDSTHLLKTSDPTIQFMVLLDGSCVDTNFYRRLKAHVLERLPLLSIGVPLPLKKICSVEFWCSFTNGQRRIAGICVANMVAGNEVKLIFMPQKHEYPKMYCCR